MIYFDNGATTFPKPRAVVNAVANAMLSYGANPGRSGHKMSVKASEIMYSCRENAARLFDFDKPENVIFTLNCTQALNTVIKGTLKKGDHAVISSLEHNAVLRPVEALKSRGVTYSTAKVVEGDADQTLNNFRNALKENTRLVVCTHASNVFGIRLPVERIAAHDILLEHPRRPTAKLHASRRMDSIADGDDYIEVVAINILNARLAWDCTMRSDHCKICNSHFGVNLAIGDSVFYMTKNDRLVLFKQLSHL